MSARHDHFVQPCSREKMHERIMPKIITYWFLVKVCNIWYSIMEKVVKLTSIKVMAKYARRNSKNAFIPNLLLKIVKVS